MMRPEGHRGVSCSKAGENKGRGSAKGPGGPLLPLEEVTWTTELRKETDGQVHGVGSTQVQWAGSTLC